MSDRDPNQVLPVDLARKVQQMEAEGHSEEEIAHFLEAEGISEAKRTLVTRGSRYGAFSDNASLVQALKRVLHQAEGWDRMHDVGKEAIELVLMKISRAVNGDPYWIDSWHDPQGFFKLVEDWIKKEASDE